MAALSKAVSSPMTSVQKQLSTLVVKQGVGLGGLSRALQTLAQALVWAGLGDEVMTEPEVNAALKSQLAGAAAFMATDHVELRRSLVDAGWLQRDGFGREYRRVGCDQLRENLRAIAAEVSAMDLPPWVAQCHAAVALQREQGRQAWLATQKAVP